MVPLDLPGADPANEGLRDLAAGGDIDDCALLVLPGAPRPGAPGSVYRTSCPWAVPLALPEKRVRAQAPVVPLRSRCSNGISVPVAMASRPELRVRRRLADDDWDTACARDNALLRRLVSFEQALACGKRPPEKPPA